MTYLDNAGRKGKSTDKPLFDHFHDYLFDIHPDREQYNTQKFLAGIIPQYGTYMVGKSQTAKGANTMELYNVEFSDITYPWLSKISGGNEFTAGASAGWQFSQNVASLYKSVVRSGKRAEERRKRAIRAQLAREARERRYRYHRNYRW